MNMLNGNKTYLMVAIGILYIVGGKYLKLWEVDGHVLTMMGLAAGAFLRAGVAKAEAAVEGTERTPVTEGTSKPPSVLGFYLVGMACLGLLFAVCAGCVNKAVVTTNPDGTSVTNFVKGPDVARISRLAGGAAQIGTQLRLAGHPEDRQIFETTRQALQSLADAKNYDPAAFSAALSALPVKTLQGEQGAIYISGAILVWDEAISVAEPLTRQELVAATLTAVAEGIGRGLAVTAGK